MISDAHLVWSYLRPTVPRARPDGRPAVLTEHHRPLSAYLAAALPLGFQVRHCEEPGRPMTLPPAPDTLPAHMSWELLHWCPDAATAARGNAPVVVVWHFQLGAANAAARRAEPG